jgi:DNA-binding response OmpR family regulator
MKCETLGLVFKSVTTAYDAESALVLSQSLPPDIVITDVMLPGMNGIAFAILMRTIYPDCRVLLISGDPATGDVLRDAEAQGHTFEMVAKPCHPHELLARVNATSFPN